VPINGIAMPTNRFYKHGPQIFIRQTGDEFSYFSSYATSNGFGEALAERDIRLLKR
jgi:hypothetical protein